MVSCQESSAVGQNMAEKHQESSIVGSKMADNLKTGDAVGYNMVDSMEKLLEDFLMPPPDPARSFVLRNSVDSLRDASCTSLDRSGNSSSTTGSWNSSCSCHSRSSVNNTSTKSTFVFHKQPILPPLLCSSSRTEMKIYKMKAVEREQRRKEKEKQRLISRVEAILSSVEVSPAKTMKPKISKKSPVQEEEATATDITVAMEDDVCLEEPGNIESSDDTISLHDNSSTSSNEGPTAVIECDQDNVISSHGNQCIDHVSLQNRCENDIISDHGDGLENSPNPNDHCESDNFNNHDNEDIVISKHSNKDDDVTGLHDSDSDDITSYHDNVAYRSSLRNLLQKSTNQSGLVGSPVQNLKEKMEDEDKGSNSTKSSSESEADVTENTVVDMRVKKMEYLPEKDNIMDESYQKIKNVHSKLEIIDIPRENCLESENASSKLLGKQTPEQNLSDVNLNYQNIENLLQENTLVESIVQTALKDAKNQLENEHCEKSLLSNNDVCDVNYIDTLLHNNHSYDITKPTEKDKKPNTNTQYFTQKSSNSIISPQNSNQGEISSWETPKINKNSETAEISPLSVTNSHFFELHDQSTSTKVNYPLEGDEGHISSRKSQTPTYSNDIAQKIDSSPILPNESQITNHNEIVELQGNICYESTIIEAYPVAKKTNEEDDEVTMNHDLTMLKPVMSETVSDVTMTSSAIDETVKENIDPSMETGSLSSLKRSVSFTLDQPSPEFESAVIEAVSQHFHGNKDTETMNKHFDEAKKPSDLYPEKVKGEIAAAKKKKMLQARVRRGSYTLDEPSPYLLKNKENLMIDPDNFDDEVYSETMTMSTSDVKRKLDLPSDSEESSIPASCKKESKVGNGSVSKAELNVTNLCRLLQDQHKQQMEEMKRKHQEQLQNLQKEIVQKPKDMSLPLESVVSKSFKPHDVTVSPSLASTEYKEIRLHPKPTYEDPVLQVPFLQPSGPFGDGTQYYLEDSSDYPPETLENVDSPEEIRLMQPYPNVHRAPTHQFPPALHEKFCKLSALCKGHLTRKLLGSNKVQEMLQVIRDTSRLILSLRMEENIGEENAEKEGKTESGMDPVKDDYLENRLYNQLRSAIHQFHNIFFNISTRERMYIIAQSNFLQRSAEKKKHKPQQLSMATQKSMERKRLLSTNSDVPSHPAVSHSKGLHKEVKSKISHIWKTEPVKLPEKKSPTMSLPSKVPSQSKKSITQKPNVTSQNKVKSPVTSQIRSTSSKKDLGIKSISPVASQSRSMTSQQRKKLAELTSSVTSQQSKSPTKSPSKKVMSQTSNVTSQLNSKVTSQRTKATSQSNTKVMSQTTKPIARKTVQNRKPTPLTSRGNLRGHI